MDDIAIIINELRKPAYDQKSIGQAIAGLSAKMMEMAEVQEVFKGDLTDPRIQRFIIDFSGIFAKFNNFATNAEGLKEFLTSTSTYESFHTALDEGFAELKRIQNAWKSFQFSCKFKMKNFSLKLLQNLKFGLFVFVRTIFLFLHLF